MYDSFKREIYYLRISVTDKCNLRCTYCMPEEGVPALKHSSLLTFEQIAEITKSAVSLSFRKFRLTGGEPLVRRGIADLVRMMKEIEGVEFLGMTTNGVLLPQFAPQLKSSGLDSLNISLDTLDPDLYHTITRIGNIEAVFKGINAAQEAGFDKIKINMVVTDETTDEELATMQEFTLAKGLTLQRIRQYSLLTPKSDEPVYERPPKCGACNRIRLTHDGFLKSCLHGNQEIPVDFEDIAGSLMKTINSKPFVGQTCTNREINSIGG